MIDKLEKYGFFLILHYDPLCATHWVGPKCLCPSRHGTVKSLIDAWAFIRIISFHGEGGGHLLEAIVFANYIWTPKMIYFFPMAAILLLRKGLVS